MADKDMLTMSRREAMRLHILHQALERKVTQQEAARLMGLSERQVRRLIRRVRLEGDPGICHRARGKASNHRIPPQVKARVLALFRKQDSDFNLVHAPEKLEERDGIALHAETLRLWVRAAGLPYKQRKARAHRRGRERKAHRGELLQFDGSHHDGFEGRGPRCVFRGAIDDATTTVRGRVYAYEGTGPALDSRKRYIRRSGIPQAIYRAKHSTYKRAAAPPLEEQLRDAEPLSHGEKSRAARGIEVIQANSPQAKGRVERLFKTLQDRLVRELRLRGIQSGAEANVFLRRYLPQHNPAVPPTRDLPRRPAPARPAQPGPRSGLLHPDRADGHAGLHHRA